MIDHRNLHLRSGFAFIALMAVMGLSILGLTRCRLVEDRLTGIALDAPSTLSARDQCVRSCNGRFKSDRKAEETRHRNALRACGRDESCQRAEERRHRERLRDILNDRKRCKRNCYNEGSGSAGR